MFEPPGRFYYDNWHQAFLNIGAMIAIAPLSGIPLPFISHGRSSFATLAALGIVLNALATKPVERPYDTLI